MLLQLGRIIEDGAARLAPHTTSPQLDAQVLAAHVTARTRTWVVAHADEPFTVEQALTFEALIKRLEQGEPLPYVIGHHEFFGLDFDISPDVLIPRPETELLVQRALDWLAGTPGRREVADIGTGSGCIAISIASSMPNTRVLATDISPAAIQIARGNARKIGVASQMRFELCDLLPGRGPGVETQPHLDLVCANLPYIPTAELRSLPIFAREPSLALDGGPDGLDPFRRLFSVSPQWIAPGGLMLLEIEAQSGPAVLSLAYDAFHAAAIHLHKDAADRDRLLEIQLNGSA